MHNTAEQIRGEFRTLLAQKKFTCINREASMTGLVGNTTIEIIGANFIADTGALFGTVNWEYVKREEAWYESRSLNVNDIPGGPPAIWKAVADKDGLINSNYGFLVFAKENGSQYDNVLSELKTNPASRRATMIYTRPSIWAEYNKNGMSDFICTNTVGYVIREDKLHAVVHMRSNDAIMGLKNDRAWQSHILNKLANDLGIEPGNIYWNVTSLHIYARHYFLVDHYSKTGETAISKDNYVKLYPDSAFI